MRGRAHTRRSFVTGTSFRSEVGIVCNILEMMGPYHKGTSTSTSSEIIMSRNVSILIVSLLDANPPSILDHQTEIMPNCKSDSGLYVTHGHCINTYGGNTALFTREIEGSIQITSAD